EPSYCPALERRTAPHAGYKALAHPEVLSLRALAAAPPSVAAAAGPFVLSAPAEALARAITLLHRPHLAERPLHRVERLVLLAVLERLHALGGIGAPVSALASQALHLLQELLQLLRRDLIRPHAAFELLRLLEHHLVLAR